MGLFHRVSDDGASTVVFQDHEGAILTLNADLPGADQDQLTVTWSVPTADAPAAAVETAPEDPAAAEQGGAASA